MLTLLFKAFDNRDGLEVTALAFTLHRATSTTSGTWTDACTSASNAVRA